MVTSKSKSGPGRPLNRGIKRTRLGNKAVGIHIVKLKPSRKAMTNPDVRTLIKGSEIFTDNPARIKPVIRQYLKAVVKSRKVGGMVSFQISVDPEGRASFKDIESAPSPLNTALAKARERGRLLATEILSQEDMKSAEEIADILGTSRVTINAKRQAGQILGIDGAKRGFRFPLWQFNANNKPYPEIEKLHGLLDGPWSVYRFLVQKHPEMNGLTGLEAIKGGEAERALAVAESVGRDFS